MLAVLVTGQFMALLDVTIVNVAIPTIRADLGASGSALQLVVAGYTVVYAMLLITGARLGTLRGHRGVFMTGLLTFTLGSLACGLAPATGVLVAARLLQGAGAALMVPQVISVIQQQFTGADRARALGVYAASLATGAATGQVLGGLLVSADLLGASWRPVFLVNVPVGLLLAVLASGLLPGGRAASGRRLDLVGLVTSSAGILLVVLPLVLGHEQGWPAWTWAGMAAGALTLVGFVVVERSLAARGGDPLLKLEVLRAPGMVAGLAALTVAMVGYGAFLFVLALHLQAGLGDSPLRAGLTVAPAAVAFGLGGYFWRSLPARVHHALTPIGFVVTSLAYVGLAAILRGGTHGGVWLPVLAVVYGVGMSMAFSPLVTQSLVWVAPALAADASGLLTTTLQLSQVAGVAVFGSVFLSLAGQVRPDASAVAVATVYGWIAVMMLAGLVGAVLLARTVRDAARAAAG